jgi:hypothetical protein
MNSQHGGLANVTHVHQTRTIYIYLNKTQIKVNVLTGCLTKEDQWWILKWVDKKNKNKKVDKHKPKKSWKFCEDDEKVER